jgi:hypothetical protein
MLKNVIQAAPACPDQVRSEWSNQIARAKDFLTRVVERETRHASKIVTMSDRQRRLTNLDLKAVQDINVPWH